MPDFSENLLLKSLAPGDLDLIAADLTYVSLAKWGSVAKSHRPIQDVYFPVTAMISSVGTANGRAIELGVTGLEGMTGLSLLLEIEQTPFEAYAQIPGDAFRLPAVVLAGALAKSPSLRRHLLNFFYVFQVQISQTAVANGIQKIEARLARWLLMCHDRSQSDDLDLAHEFLAIMLAVRRAGVSNQLSLFDAAGHISTNRGRIKILDRRALRALAGNTYGVAEAEYLRIFGFSAARAD